VLRSSKISIEISKGKFLKISQKFLRKFLIFLEIYFISHSYISTLHEISQKFQIIFEKFLKISYFDFPENFRNFPESFRNFEKFLRNI